jgi:hypothetical protein
MPHWKRDAGLPWQDQSGMSSIPREGKNYNFPPRCSCLTTGTQGVHNLGHVRATCSHEQKKRHDAHSDRRRRHLSQVIITYTRLMACVPSRPQTAASLSPTDQSWPRRRRRAGESVVHQRGGVNHASARVFTRMGRIAASAPRMSGLVEWVHPGSGGRRRRGVVATIDMRAVR